MNAVCYKWRNIEMKSDERKEDEQIAYNHKRLTRRFI